MRKIILLASAAAMAVSMPALAQGRGNGQGKGGGQPQAAQVRGGGGGHQAHGRGQGRAQQAQQVRQTGNRGNGRGNAQAVRADRGQGQARQAERRQERAVQRVERRAERDVRQAEREVRRVEQREVRDLRRADSRDWTRWANTPSTSGNVAPVAAAAGRACPPGLAKQNAFCLPPGQLRRAQMMGQRIDRSRFGPVPEDWLFRFRDDNDFYYLYDDDGFIYRVDRDNDFVSSIIPLLGSGLMIGEPLPLGYEVYNLPVPYRDHYVDDDDWLYRYDDGAIYRVDNDTGLIESVVALLTGNPISVGQQLPSGYDVYNLPFDYRDRYVDDADSMYRYSNGAIYQVDPTTQLVQALVEMIL